MIHELTILTGAEVQYSGQCAVFGDLLVSTEALVIRVDNRRSQGGRKERVAVHPYAFEFIALHIAG